MIDFSEAMFLETLDKHFFFFFFDWRNFITMFFSWVCFWIGFFEIFLFWNSSLFFIVKRRFLENYIGIVLNEFGLLDKLVVIKIFFSFDWTEYFFAVDLFHREKKRNVFLRKISLAFLLPVQFRKRRIVLDRRFFINLGSGGTFRKVFLRLFSTGKSNFLRFNLFHDIFTDKIFGV